MWLFLEDMKVVFLIPKGIRPGLKNIFAAVFR
jgi:hypothetical protein